MGIFLKKNIIIMINSVLLKIDKMSCISPEIKFYSAHHKVHDNILVTTSYITFNC